MNNEQSINEFAESVDGFEDIAIAKHFGKKLAALSEDTTDTIRALVFADARRKGQTDPQAYETAMKLPYGQLFTYFAIEEDEPMPDEPVTESGKDD